MGSGLWLVGIAQFLVVQVLVQMAWKTPYSWATFNISDLGNVLCQDWGEAPRTRFVCSPWHDLMNGSVVLLGVSLLTGVALLWSQWQSGWNSLLSRLVLLLGLAGWILVGLYPADMNENLHVIGAFLVFFLGNVGLLWTAFSFRALDWRRLRWWVAGLGALGLAGTWLFLSNQALGIGLGGMERVAAYSHLLAFVLLGGLTLRRGAH